MFEVLYFREVRVTVNEDGRAVATRCAAIYGVSCMDFASPSITDSIGSAVAS